MDGKVREYLVQLAKQGKTTSYSQLNEDCNLGIDFNLQVGRNQLAQILHGIGTYEYYSGRPVLTAVVLQKNKTVQSIGFFNLCAELGLGDAKDLQARQYGQEELNRCFEFWQRENADSEHKHPVPFFTIGELEFFKEASKIRYRNDAPDAIEKEKRLKKLVEKLNYWVNETAGEGWSVHPQKNFQHSGWLRQGYWARIFREGQEDKKIFFVLAIDPQEGLLYKLECFKDYPKAKLPQEKINRFNKFLENTGAVPKFIPFDKVGWYDWDSLIEETQQYINTFGGLYDAAIDIVWRNDSHIRNGLQKQPRPVGMHSELPPPNYNFKGRNIDHIAKNQYNQVKGEQGEQLVIQEEQNRLRACGMEDCASQVRKVLDGEGYDILSFDEAGNEKYIEVKTTTNKDKHMPFYLTDVELAFMEQNVGKYHIYRIYNFDPTTNSGDYYVLSGDVSQQLLLQPTQYHVHIKKMNANE